MERNGRNVTVRELNDKLDTVRAEQKSEHMKTRAIVIVGATVGAKLSPLLIGLIALHH